METPTPVSENTCALCHKSAKSSCGGCIGAPDINNDAKITHYCSVRCQKEDWPNHKAQCQHLQTRKKLFRVGDVLQAMFYMYRERLYDKKVKRIEEKGGKLIFYEGDYKEAAGDPIVPFPNHLVGNEKNKQAVLAYLSCTDVLIYMDDLVKYLLSGLAIKRIEEVKMVIRTYKRETICIDSAGGNDTNQYKHNVIQVVLQHGGAGNALLGGALEEIIGGEQHILDLSGAQYGYYKPVVPLVQYIDERSCIIHFDDEMAFGSMKGVMEATAADADVLSRTVHKLNKEVSRTLVSATKQWEQKGNLTVRQMLKLPQQEFDMHLDGLVTFVDSEIRSHIARACSPNLAMMKRFRAEEKRIQGLAGNM